MSYSTPAMVRKAIVPSSDGLQPQVPSNTAADLSDGVIQDAITEADSLIDSYIAARYTVPVAVIATGNPGAEDGADGAIPHPIDFWSRTLASYLVTCTYRGSQDFADTDPIFRRYSAVMQSLQAVSGGKANLPLPTQGGPSSGVTVGSAQNPYIGDLFTPDDFDLTPSWSPQLQQGFGNDGCW